MDLMFWNTRSRALEAFAPVSGGVVRMYHCGPTVYGPVHIGNIRSFFLADMVRRACEASGYDVKQVMNITDVDDKTIKGAREAGMPLAQFTQMHEEGFLRDIDAMNILRPKTITHATAYIPHMIAMIETLLKNGHAYTAEDGVYFSVRTFPTYAALAHIQLSAHTEERITNDTYDKAEARDFALWKFYKESEDGDVSWDASFGKGRPGWHIECSAMAIAELGETIDIHTGGIDLLFPHHTNEVAQSESVTGKEFSRFFVHGEFVMMGEKMSKSLGNVLTLKDLGKYSPLAYRYLLLQTHYRTALSFSFESLEAAWTALRKLALMYPEHTVAPDMATPLSILVDDLDTPGVLANLWTALKDESKTREEKDALLVGVNNLLGLGLDKLAVSLRVVPEEIQQLLAKRNEARKQKDFGASDELRDEMQKLGFGVEDGPLGSRAYPL